jgi:DNA-binding NtrC family response regulator
VEYDYPGNIRELEHAVERALIFQEGEVIRAGDLPPEFRGRGRVTEFSELFGLAWEEAKARVERM